MEPSRIQHPAYVTATSPTVSQPSNNVNTTPTTSTNTATDSRKRKSSNGTGSRGISTLTPEQLAKKRANDREAQRAIRERTKIQIQTLETKIRELTEQRPFLELQNALRQKELVEAENEDLKRKLTSIMSIVQPLNGMPGPESSQAPYPYPDPRSSILSPIATSAAYDNRPAAPIAFNEGKVVDSASTSYASSPRIRNPEISSSYTSQPSELPTVASLSRRHDSTGQQSTATHPPVVDDKLDINYLLQQSRQNSGEPRLLYSSSDRTQSGHAQNMKPGHNLSRYLNGAEDPPPVYSMRPTNCDETGPLDGLLLKFLNDQREQLAQGVPADDIIGPPYPSFRTLLDPETTVPSHPLSKVFTDLLGKFPDISTVPEQAGILHIMFLLMRWQIHPTQETYERMPDWISPRPSQLFTPHPAWVDNIPWPRMRDKMTVYHPKAPFDEFFIPYTTTVSLNWPYEDRDCLVAIPDSEELALSPLFEQHVLDLGNWTLGERFARTFPELAHTFKKGTPRKK